MNIIRKIKNIFKKEVPVQLIDDEWSCIEYGLRNHLYDNITNIESIERDIEYLKKRNPDKNYIAYNYIKRLEARIEEIKRGKE